LATTECQELPSYRGGALGRFADVLDVLTNRRAELRLSQNEAAGAKHHGHLVVGLVRHSPGQLADDLDAFCLPQPVFGEPPFGEIENEEHRIRHVPQPGTTYQHRDSGAVLPQKLLLIRGAAALGLGLLGGPAVELFEAWRSQLPMAQESVGQILPGVAEHREERVVGVGHALSVPERDPDHSRLEHAPEARFARLDRGFCLAARRDISLRAPGTKQLPVGHDADQVVQEIALVAFPVDLVGLGVGEPVAPNEGPQVLQVLGVGPGHHLAETGADQLGGLLVAVHVGNSIVALG